MSSMTNKTHQTFFGRGCSPDPVWGSAVRRGGEYPSTPYPFPLMPMASRREPPCYTLTL